METCHLPALGDHDLPPSFLKAEVLLRHGPLPAPLLSSPGVFFIPFEGPLGLFQWRGFSKLWSYEKSEGMGLGQLGPEATPCCFLKSLYQVGAGVDEKVPMSSPSGRLDLPSSPLTLLMKNLLPRLGPLMPLGAW